MSRLDVYRDWIQGKGLDFSAPFWAVGLSLIVAILFGVWVWKRYGREVAVPYDHSTQSSGRGWWFTISFAETLLPLLTGIVLLVLCNPLSSGTPVEKRSVSNIQFCVDSSTSMLANFGDGNRYEASIAAINQFLGYREGDAFGLTFFANGFVHWCPLTTDSSAFQCVLPFMKPNGRRTIGGGTQIRKALNACREELKDRDDGDKMIILVSDGQSSDMGNGGAEKIAKKLLDDNVTVFGIHIGGGEIPEQILTVTHLTNGAAFLPGDTDSLDDVFRKIDSMKPAEIEFVEADKIDDFRPWCLAALGVLSVWLLSQTWLRYTPW